MALILTEKGWLHHGQPAQGTSWNPETRVAHLHTSFNCSILVEVSKVLLKGHSQCLTGNKEDHFKGICCDGQKEIVIEDLKVQNFDVGFHMNDCENITLLNCEASENIFGMHLEYCKKSLIVNNHFYGNQQCGLFALHSTFTSLYGCDFKENKGTSIHLQHNQGTLLGHNHLCHSDYALYVQASVSSWLVNNTIESARCGVLFKDYCKNNNMTGNKMINCDLTGLALLCSTTHSIISQNSFMECRNGILLYKNSLSDILDNEINVKEYSLLTCESSGIRFTSNKGVTQLDSPLVFISGNQLVLEDNKIVKVIDVDTMPYLSTTQNEAMEILQTLINLQDPYDQQ